MTPRPQVRLDPLLELFWKKGFTLFAEEVRREYALATPFFVDLRQKLHEDLDALDALGAALHRKLVEIVGETTKPQQVIGIPDTATPIALAAAQASRGTSLPLIYGQLRKHPAAYPGGIVGSHAYMGIPRPGREITLIDDVMASGRTKVWSIEELAKAGLSVKRILVVVDREQGGDELLAERGYPAHALYRASEIADYFEATGRIDRPTAEAARDHFRRRRFKRV